MSADHDVDLAFAQAIEDVFDLLIGFETRDAFDFEGIAREARTKGAFVLFSEDGGGHEHGDLLAEFSGFEGSADGEFGFAKAHVAAEEAVHGAFGVHVAFDFLQRGELVGGFFVGELFFEFVLPICVVGVAGAWEVFACGADAEEFAREVFDAFGDAILLVLPLLAAEGAELGLAGEAADVFLHAVDLGSGNVELAGAGEFEDEIFLLFLQAFGVGGGREDGALRDGQLTRGHEFEAQEAGDAVFLVDDVVTFVKVEEGVHRAVGAHDACAATDSEAGHEFVIRNEGE